MKAMKMVERKKKNTKTKTEAENKKVGNLDNKEIARESERCASRLFSPVCRPPL